MFTKDQDTPMESLNNLEDNLENTISNILSNTDDIPNRSINYDTEDTAKEQLSVRFK